MKKLLTVCIPTYKRPITLRRCIDSVVSQIEALSLADSVGILVVNDASPDNTAEVMQGYESLSYFTAVTRQENLGMNVNIKTMFEEVNEQSDYQLIITDDDYLQPGVLAEITDFLHDQLANKNRTPVIWTPRYSYTEDGELHRIVCNPFNSSHAVGSSAFNAGKYMFNGFVLSGLILQARNIDFDFWDTYSENAYFPILFFGDLIARDGAYYWDKNIVHHTVLNDCHWERWGKNDAVIHLRLFSDFANAFSVMRGHLKGKLDSVKFYFSSFSSMNRLITGRATSDQLNANPQDVYEAATELKHQGILRFEILIKFQIFCALIRTGCLLLFKSLAYGVALIFAPKKDKRELYSKRIQRNSERLSAVSVFAKSVFL